jgi:hypothetical protein
VLVEEQIRSATLVQSFVRFAVLAPKFFVFLLIFAEPRHSPVRALNSEGQLISV